MRRVSVIIPVWNRKELLARTLRTILDQSLTPFEIIVVDDHSTDGTPDFIRAKFGDQVKVITTNGKGPGAARNTGFSASSGEYIKFFDSDDLMTRTTLEDQVNAIERTGKSSAYGACFFAQEVELGEWRLTDEAILQYHSAINSRPLFHWMTRGLFITIPSFTFRRELLERIGPWREDITTYEDFDLLWRIALVEPFPVHVNSSAFLYRMHGKQITGSDFNSSRRDHDKVLAFTMILENVRNRANVGTLNRLLFETIIATTLKKNSEELWSHEFSFAWQKTKYNLLAKLQVALNKVGRIRTGTNWQPMHGPTKDRGIVLKYLSMISPDFTLIQPGT